MTQLVWEEAPLRRHHDRAAFDCDDDDPNTYLKRYARQNHDNGGAKCFVAAPRDTPTRILGFYSLSPASIEFSRTPLVVTRGLGRCCCGARWNVVRRSPRRLAVLHS
jgi:hypothetical protein